MSYGDEDDFTCFHVSELTEGARPLFELAVAIRRGDLKEAEHQLDQLAKVLGSSATEAVQQARFSPRASPAPKPL